MCSRSAVYVSKASTRAAPAAMSAAPAASLLIFDLNGQLKSAFALESWQTVHNLAIDDQFNIWTLAGFNPGNDPSVEPMVVEYSDTGVVLKELLPRSLFPLHARSVTETPSTGHTAMGFSAGVVWFWLPGSTDLVTISVNDGKTSIMKTALPTGPSNSTSIEQWTRTKPEFVLGPNDAEVPLGAAFKASDNSELIAEFRETDSNGESTLAYYSWSPSTTFWSQFNPGACDGARLIGSDDAGQIYLRFGSDRDEICSFSDR